jgi:hypothetical protein
MWVTRLTDKQRRTLIALLGAQERLGPTLSGALEALELSRWDDLPDAELPWEEVTRLADAQGISEADVIWDLAGKGAAR